MVAKAMEIKVEDGRIFKVMPSDWIGEGGEGAVYKKGNLVIKIVEDKSALASKEPKLSIFKKIRHPLLATPLGLAYDTSGALVGYLMEYIEGSPLARAMTPSWRAQNGIGDSQLEHLCKSMVSAVEFLHKKGVWGGDLNEFNWKFKSGEAVLIDCDSWGCNGHPVSAMMPSIADPKAHGNYKAQSDWYALAILFFTLYAGIHPYRGSVEGFGPKDMIERMKKGASLFSQKARWPASVPGPDAIPKGLRPWLEKTLDGSLREAPPKGSWSVVERIKKSVKSSGTLDFPSKFERWAYGGLIQLNDGSFFDLETKSILKGPSKNAWRWIDNETGEPWWVWQEGQKLKGSSQEGSQFFETAIASDTQVAYWAEEPWAAKEGSWSSFAIRKMGSTGIKAIPCAQGLLGGAQEWLDGCMLCASMGALVLMRPIGKSKGLMALQLKAPIAGSKLSWGSAKGAFEMIEWVLPDGNRLVNIQTKGKLIKSMEGSLDWACELSINECLLQISGEAWIVSIKGLKKVEGWLTTDIPSSCFKGLLWRVDSDGLSAKSYSVSKILN